MLAVFHTRLLSSCNWTLRRWCGVLAAGSWHCAKILPSAWPWSLCAIHQVEFGFSHGIQGVVKAPNNFNTFNKFFHYDFTMCYFSDFVSYIEHILEQSRLKQKPGERFGKEPNRPSRAGSLPGNHFAFHPGTNFQPTKCSSPACVKKNWLVCMVSFLGSKCLDCVPFIILQFSWCVWFRVMLAMCLLTVRFFQRYVRSVSSSIFARCSLETIW